MDRPHKSLDVWKVSMELAVKIYRVTATLPADERFGLVSQMRRAAFSIPSNLTEGAARGSKNEFRRFLYVARGSLSELDTQLDMCLKLGFIAQDSRRELDAILVRVDSMLNALRESIKRKSAKA